MEAKTNENEALKKYLMDTYGGIICRYDPRAHCSKPLNIPCAFTADSPDCEVYIDMFWNKKGYFRA